MRGGFIDIEYFLLFVLVRVLFEDLKVIRRKLNNVDRFRKGVGGSYYCWVWYLFWVFF